MLNGGPKKHYDCVWHHICPGQEGRLALKSALDTQGAVEARNANYATIMRHLRFAQHGWLDTAAWPEEADDRITARKVSVLSEAESSGYGEMGGNDSDLDSQDGNAGPLQVRCIHLSHVGLMAPS